VLPCEKRALLGVRLERDLALELERRLEVIELPHEEVC
jgi:hypothetical protein